MNQIPSIHDAYGGFGQKAEAPSRIQLKQIQKSESAIKPSFVENNEKQKMSSKIDLKNTQNYTQQQKNSLPKHADHAQYPTRICCPKCRNVGVTRMQSELGTAAWVWCVLLFPFAGTGLICLCLDSCRDRVHYCTRCGNIVGKKDAKVC